jgi:hypothetical protein
VQYAVVRIVGGREDFRIFAFSHRWGKILLVRLLHLRDGLQPRFAAID